jgi:Glycosyl transferase family group 2
MNALILTVWLFPFVELAFMAYGLAHAAQHRPKPGASGATEAIIQITTIGNHATVNWIIEQIRSYQLPFPYQLWVVVEPWTGGEYVGMDELLVVPEDFETKASHKARAQEFSRYVRSNRGLNRSDVKITMVDDDTLPTRDYLIDVFNADYDVCEGITTPRLGYGRFFSHMDDLRTLSCMVICSTFQGHGHPIWVHGEGLTMRGTAEETVTWDYPVIASEDLVFGHNAVALGLSWGFVWEYVQLTSPWNWGDFLKQRRRWLWGNIHAIQNGLIPPMGAAMVAFRYVLGVVIFSLSLLGIVLVPSGIVHVSSSLFWPLMASLGIWLAMFGVACWIGTGAKAKPFEGRVLDTAIGMILAIVTSAATCGVIVVAFCMGKPKTFEVIEKSKPVAAHR